MKKAIVFTSLMCVFLLAGCSSGSKTGSQATATATVAQEISNVDPLLNQNGYDRRQLTDPALYTYLEEKGVAVEDGTTSIIDPAEQKKIGLVTKFRNATKYGITGSATIISATKIKITQFSYNGACGPVTVGLLNQNNPTKPLATVKDISAATTNAEFVIEVPSNLSLLKFDNIGVYCPDIELPVSTANITSN